MSDFLSTVADNLKWWQSKWHTKVFYGTIILFVALVFNDFTGFTYYYFNGKKVEQAVRISEALGDNGMNADVAHQLDVLRSEILSRQSVSSVLFKNKNINKPLSPTQNAHSAINPTIEKGAKSITVNNSIPAMVDTTCIATNNSETIITASENAPNPDILFPCASWSLWVVFVLIFTSVYNRRRTFRAFFIIAASMIMITSIQCLFYWFFGLIFFYPISGSHVINYILVAISSPVLSCHIWYVVNARIDAIVEWRNK